MAFNIGVVQYSGKLGNTVGATKSAGQKANTIRIKPTSVKNPQTNSQILQRMKVRAAANLYAALGRIIDHAFQGVEYGAPSHNYFNKLFLSKAMSLDDDNKFAIYKGDNRPLPFPVVIASGSAPVVSFGMSEEEANCFIKVSTTATSESSLLSILQAVNPEIQKGDQLTFVAAILTQGNSQASAINRSYPVRYDVRRIILDGEEDDMKFSDYTELTGITPTFDNELGLMHLTYPSGIQIAFAVILSRPSIAPNGTDIKWERSNTSIACGGDYLVAVNDDENLKGAINSYKKSAASTESPWYLNQGEL